MDDDTLKVFGYTALGIWSVVVFAVIVVAGWFVSGWVLLRLWEWFILPVFESAPQLTVWQAVGLQMVVQVMTDKPELAQTVKDPKKKKVGWMLRHIFLMPLVTVVMAWMLWTFFIK